MKSVCFCLFSLVIGLACVASVPSAEEIKAVMPQIKEITRDDLASLKSKKKTPVQAAEAILGYISADDKLVTKFVLSRMAFEQLIIGLAFEQADELYSTALVDGGAEYALGVVETSRMKLYGFANPKHPQAKLLMKRVSEDEKSIRGVISVKAKIKKDPKNPALYEQLAIEYLACGEWVSALDAFSRCSAKVAKVAAWELGDKKAGKNDPAKVAKYWWSFSEGYTDRKTVCDVIRVHAAKWYKKAIDQNLLTGLDAKVAAKRIEEAESFNLQVVVREYKGEGGSTGPRSDVGSDKVVASGRGGAVKAAASAKGQAGTYMVVDLTKTGPSAISYLASVPSGGWSDAYRTTKMVLRRIDSGFFEYMPGRTFTITKPFYIGVFEVTQKQYSLLTETNPSEFFGDTHPVEMVSYVDIRGKVKGITWPIDDEVDEGSFLSYIRKRTGVRFELPTEAQWEYACRAGTKGLLNVDGAKIEDLGRSRANGGAANHHEVVGHYLPNAWGLYDMLGNVWEWCVDRAEDEVLRRIQWSGASKEKEVDPVGPSTGTRRLRRGGGHYNAEHDCNCGVRRIDAFVSKSNALGFRLVCPVQ